MMAVITQGSLMKLRVQMFGGMQTLPVKYFDTHNHGDIMSHYTNDIDTLRQLISQSLPQLLVSAIVISTVLFIMLYYCVWLTLVVIAGVCVMLVVTKKIGGRSARHFVRQQQALGAEEGYIEEIMNGQKVVKVFCHEEACKADFDRINENLFSESESANKFANTLGPILNNIGNVLYAAVGMTGGLLLLSGVTNLSISGLALGISVIVPFLTARGGRRLRHARERARGKRRADRMQRAHRRMGVEAPASGRRQRDVHQACGRRADVRRRLRLRGGQNRPA